jgi:hypothetical protein
MALAVLLLTAIVAGCGGEDEPAGPPPQPAPSGRPADFPTVAGKTLTDLRGEAEESLVLSPSVQDLDRGTNRYGFALFDTARKQIAGAQVALYTAREDGTGLRGPFVARSESLRVKGPFRSVSTSSDPDAAKAVYVADVDFRRTGKQVVTAMTKLDGRLLATSVVSVTVGGRAAAGQADVGGRAIRIHTQTLEDVGGDAAQISTRKPPAEDLLQTDFAEVVGRKPVVISFATPLLCASRVCGPVIDIVEQVKSTAPKDVAFIHQEIYRDNKVEKGVRSQVAAWNLRSEPWTFVVDRRGRIAERFEGAFSAGELQRAIAKATRDT